MLPGLDWLGSWRRWPHVDPLPSKTSWPSTMMVGKHLPLGARQTRLSQTIGSFIRVFMVAAVRGRRRHVLDGRVQGIGAGSGTVADNRLAGMSAMVGFQCSLHGWLAFGSGGRGGRRSRTRLVDGAGVQLLSFVSMREMVSTSSVGGQTSPGDR
jgi:hypothetical protein